MDVNEIGVDPQNNVYFAGDGGDTCWMSKLDSSAGKYATPVAIAGQVANHTYNSTHIHGLNPGFFCAVRTRARRDAGQTA